MSINSPDGYGHVWHYVRLGVFADEHAAALSAFELLEQTGIGAAIVRGSAASAGGQTRQSRYSSGRGARCRDRIDRVRDPVLALLLPRWGQKGDDHHQSRYKRGSRDCGRFGLCDTRPARARNRQAQRASILCATARAASRLSADHADSVMGAGAWTTRQECHSSPPCNLVQTYVFAGYGSEGDHRATLSGASSIVLALGPDDFTIEQ